MAPGLFTILLEGVDAYFGPLRASWGHLKKGDNMALNDEKRIFLEKVPAGKYIVADLQKELHELLLRDTNEGKLQIILLRQLYSEVIR